MLLLSAVCKRWVIISQPFLLRHHSKDGVYSTKTDPLLVMNGGLANQMIARRQRKMQPETQKMSFVDSMEDWLATTPSTMP